MTSEMKIYIVDDHSLFTEGLCYLLENCKIPAQIKVARKGQEFLENLGSFNPDIVLMDIEMPDMNGIETTKIALSKYPDLKIIALSMYSDENYYMEMIEAGACGFLLKNSEFNDVQTAILDVFQGKNYFSPEILTSIINSFSRKVTPEKTPDLTKREIEVLHFICKGFSNHEIAEILNISKRTVDKHRENILLKGKCRNTAELVVFAIKEGFFEI